VPLRAAATAAAAVVLRKQHYKTAQYEV